MRFLFFAGLLVAVAGCPSSAKPTKTGTTCADPDPVTGTSTLTWQNFGYDFMCHYCTNCHDSNLGINDRNGAPLFHDFDSLLGAMEVPDHIDEQAGAGPNAHNAFMPGGGTGGQCPSTPGGTLDRACLEPTPQEREQLSQWVACQRQRTTENASPAAAMSDHCAMYTGPR